MSPYRLMLLYTAPELASIMSPKLANRRQGAETVRWADAESSWGILAKVNASLRDSGCMRACTYPAAGLHKHRQ